MKILVIYDSLHGNTQGVAEEIAQVVNCSLEQSGEAQLVSIQEFKLDDLVEVDLLILGAPVRRHMVSPAVETFLDRLPACALHGLAVAVFDTHFGPEALALETAAGKMARRLRRLGARQVAPPESFHIETESGPLSPGELERAEVWAASIIQRLCDE